MNRDTIHSRSIFVIKLVLPLAALALMSTMFLLAKRPNPADAIPFAQVDVAERAREQSLTAPRFAGQSLDGATYSLTIATARPEAGNPNRMQAEGISLAIDGLRGDQTMHLRALNGALDTDMGSLQLIGDVALRSSLGFALRTNVLLAGFRDFRLTSPGEVQGVSPFGNLVAGSLRVTTQENRQLLLFENGVNLLYDPGEQGN